jgi:uncharacterized protein (DUF1501 family)
MTHSRRRFLGAAAGLAAHRLNAPFALGMASLGALAAQNSQAAGSDYKALVCLYMGGGNDAHNWLIPNDTAGYADYLRARPALALQRETLLPLSAAPAQGGNRGFALAPELQPLRDLYEQQRLAFVANVGTLKGPTTLADFKAGSNLPAKLFSHNDQASTFQSFSPEGAHAGWGGRMGDVLMSANSQPIFTAISTAGSAVFLAGNAVIPYQLGVDGPVGIGGFGSGALSTPGTVANALLQVYAAQGSNPYQAEYARVVQRSADCYTVLRNALAATSVAAIPQTPVTVDNRATTLDQDPLARQLRMVAQLIAANQALGMKRQVFLVQINGFDTHANQLRDHAALGTRVAQSTGYFVAAMQTLGLGSNVTLFSASDFGRSLSSNGSGTDHGWGSHHFVAGGAVKGQNIYGTFPATALGSANDTGSGRLLPSTSVQEYAAPLGRWMGVSEADLALVLPNLTRFAAANLVFI